MSRLNYQINDHTIYIIADEMNNITESKISEMYGNHITCKQTPNSIISYNCKSHGQHYLSRKELSKSLTGLTTKIPIIVDLFGSYIFFSTHSDRVPYNNWFNLKYVEKYTPYKGMTRILFTNNEEVIIDISCNSFKNQYTNAIMLYYRFNLQKEKFYRKEMSFNINTNYRHMIDEDKERYGTYIDYLKGLVHIKENV